jgi:F-type H+-transporting ATPase subunit b
MITARRRFRWLSPLARLGLAGLAVVLLCAPARVLAQESRTAGPKPAQSRENDRKQEPGFGQQLAKETREAAGEEEDETEQFKKSASVRMLSKLTGGNLQYAYWLAVLINFGVIAGVLLWAGRKFLPGAFQARTAAIQRAMEEAKRASEDANRRLGEIQSRLSRLDDEIAAMKAAGEQELAAEEARIKAAAEEDARKIVESAEQEIEAAAKAARRDLTRYAADLAISLAQKQIHVDAKTDSSLVRGFTDRLGQGEDGGKN